MNLISAIFSLLISFYFHVQASQQYESDEIAKILFTSIVLIFGLSLVSKYCSEVPVFVKTYILLLLMPI